MYLLIDNYDSFTYNLFHYLGELGAEVAVRRNDTLTAEEGLGMAPAGSFAKGSYERVFDASLWNQNGYRLVKGGRLSHGKGRPLVVFSHDAVAEAA